MSPLSSGDKLYSDKYHNGRDTLVTYGCKNRKNVTKYFIGDQSYSTSEKIFCDDDESLDMLAPTKQNLLCDGITARNIMSRALTQVHLWLD